ncbi:hypothetical protein L2E82_34405 [Cichorium intybus]|uniref:Uncharacterized protein n=1 Tax=Cichorium intybus TaxID=13427 RepID=A0ACB9BM53_CICIN|nr:hypothetical protein L2E82_34405 [Cichorium intybus]
MVSGDDGGVEFFSRNNIGKNQKSVDLFRHDVEQLVDGNFRSLDGDRQRSFYDQAATVLIFELGLLGASLYCSVPGVLQDLVGFPSSFADVVRNRLFHPDVMSDMVNIVKILTRMKKKSRSSCICAK